MTLFFKDGQVPVAADFNEFLESAIAASRDAEESARQAAINGGGAKIGEANVFTKNQSVAPVALASGALIALDASLSNSFFLTIAHNATLQNPTNLTDGMVLNWVIEQDGVGGWTLAYGSLFDFGAAGTPVLSTEANAMDFFSGYYHRPKNKIICVMAKGF